ncbi:MAG: sigma-54 dependent transcriptional regulator [Nitrospinota bacterium]|nr:sigma-54 dependent transcriptional regulator [Nitrospinota bacterium]
MMKGKILLISGDESEQRDLARIFSDSGYATLTAETASHGQELLEQDHSIDVAVIDQDHSRPDIPALMDKVRTCLTTVQVIITSNSASFEDSNTAMKMGAFEYLHKPLDKERALLVASMASKMAHLARENNRLHKYFKEKVIFTSIAADGREMMETKEKARAVASLDTPVIITGEPGSGKQTLAEAIHNESSRADNPFIYASILPHGEDGILERHLFGYENGQSIPGAMDKAMGGTLYIYDIDLLSPSLQTALLEVLKNRTYHHVGGGQPLQAEFRLMVGSGGHLGNLVQAGRFSEELYSLLNVALLEVPPLRKRKEDIPSLAKAFLKNSCVKHNRSACAISHDTMAALTKYRWPGNVRELEETIDCMVAGKISGALSFSDLPDKVYRDVRRPSKISRQESSVQSFATEKNIFERQYLVRALEECEGNITVMARITNLSRPALYEKLRKHGLK